MTLNLKWSEPPAEALANPTQSNSFYVQVAAALRAKPGEWAQIPREFASEDSAKNTATRIRQGRMASMPKGQYEAVSHKKELWIRYVEPAEGTPVEEPQQGPRLVSSQTARAARDTNSVAAQIRAWAKNNGWPDLPNHGRLPQDAIAAYHEAMDSKEHGES
jgi:hypothetical protein